MNTCKSSCCRTPFAVCARKHACACHVDEPLDDFKHTPTDWDVVVQDKLRKDERDRIREIEGFAPWR